MSAHEKKWSNKELGKVMISAESLKDCETIQELRDIYRQLK